jgi:hypothetical protein
MGRLPATWASRVITDRIPYELSGEITMTSAQTGLQYPDATFMNTVDKPFEVHRMKPVIVGQLNGTMFSPQPDQEEMLSLVRARITDLGLNQEITKNPTLLSLLVKGSSERTWEFADPHYLTRSNLLQIVLDALAFPASFADEVNQLKVCIAFQGFLLVVAPPSENR